MWSRALELGPACSQQLDRCWSRRCCRWPRCWTTSDQPALTTGDTRQPHSHFDLFKLLQTEPLHPNPWLHCFDFFFKLISPLVVLRLPLCFGFQLWQSRRSLFPSSWHLLARLLYARRQMSWMKARTSIDSPFLVRRCLCFFFGGENRPPAAGSLPRWAALVF